MLNRTSAGISVIPESVEEYSEAILSLARDDNLREQYGNNARQTAVSEFDYKVLNKQYY